MTVLRGIAGSPGLAYGPAWVLVEHDLAFERELSRDANAEWTQVERGMAAVQRKLADWAASAQTVDTAAVLGSHADILSDPELVRDVHTAIFVQRRRAAWAIAGACERHVKLLSDTNAPFLLARAEDLRQVCAKVLEELRGDGARALPEGPVVVVARTVGFADIAALGERRVLAIALAEGGAMDHGLIVARSMGIPAVIGLGEEILRRVRPGEATRVDGSSGEVECAAGQGLIPRLRPTPVPSSTVATTLDGHVVDVLANVSSLRSAEIARVAGARGIGLLRTEFLFGAAAGVPSEEEQTRCYQAIADVFPDQEVAIRLFDVGADKPLFGLASRAEPNPALGERGVRLALRHVDTLLRPQLRALLRVQGGARLKIILPMVSCRREIEEVRKVFTECAAELRADLATRDGNMQLGIMVEVPSAAILVDTLLPCADFFSIGTNDLVQYLCAVDRSLAHLGSIVEMAEPALLRLLKRVVDVANRHGKAVSLCGEWGQVPANLALLIGMGCTRVSVNPRCVPDCRATVAKVRRSELESMLEAIEAEFDVVEARSRIISRFGLHGI